MSVNIKLKKGFDINLAGKASDTLGDVKPAAHYAIKPTDFVGMIRPKLLVKEGTQVKAGSPLFHDKGQENAIYAAPVSGEVIEIVRGAKRKVLAVKILPDKEVEYEQFNKYSVSDLSRVSKEDALSQMLKSGVWPNIIQRPFAVVANPADTPKAIFISAFDTNPLAPNVDMMFKGEEKYFQAGVTILNKLTSGAVHLNVNAKKEIPSIFASVQDVTYNKFSGPHPAGNVGVQIHHISPMNKGEVAWTISPYGVIQIGKLFLEGIYDTSRVIAMTGSEVSAPQYYKVKQGVAIENFVSNIKGDNYRIVSGNVLTGEKVEKDGYLGFYDNMLTVIPEGDHHEFFGWILPTTKKLSVHKAFGLFGGKKKEYVIDTNMKGQERAFVLTGVYDKVVPMDVLPVYLIKAIMAEDFNEMESLGIYEIAEEDFALCEFVDVSKIEVQKIVRKGLDLMRLG